MITAPDLREKFISFFEERGHQSIPSAPLVSENDSTTLFISAGIQPLVPYFLGKSHPSGKRLVNVQKCVRTGDIEEVGDVCHHTFFEMLGNWSLGDYFKAEIIPWSLELLTKSFGYNQNNLHITCFAGDTDAPKDEPVAILWRSLGIPESRIHFLPKKDNWWGPPGVTGPCGPDSEMFMDVFPDQPEVDFTLGCQTGRYIEIGNDVFIQYLKNDQGKFEKLIQDNIDTGYGVERNLAVINGFSDDYLTTIWQPIIKTIEALSNLKYGDKPDTDYIADGKQCWVDARKSMRIIADHIRSAVFIIADGVEPSNKEAGYVLRRLIRRSIRQGNLLGVNTTFLTAVATSVLDNQTNYAGDYPELTLYRDKILTIINEEEKKFRRTLDNGLKRIAGLIKNNTTITGREAFDLYQTYGFPVEMIKEEMTKGGLTLDKNDFDLAKEEHSKQSRTLSAGHYKAGLADNSEITTRYHTATHLLHHALRQVLGDHVHQAGSNITAERLRFDFTHNAKLTPEQIKQVETIVNTAITANLPVARVEIDKDEAIKQGALAFFPEKYPQVASVYTIGDQNTWFSKELCGGPHVVSTGEIGRFTITKEEASGSGVRRIYATIA